jgi:hypothetical protein
METNDKNYMIKNLVPYIPYGLIAKIEIWDEEKGFIKVQSQVQEISLLGNVRVILDDYDRDNLAYRVIGECEFYLRPLSDITKEEQEILNSITAKPRDFITLDSAKRIIDLMHSHRLDYRGLIERNSVVKPATEDMYKDIR